MTPRIDLSRRLLSLPRRSDAKAGESFRSNQVKADPYSNKTHKQIDAMLVLVTVVLIGFAFRTAAHQRTNSTAPNITNHAHAAQSQQATSK